MAHDILELASLKAAGQASRLETQGRPDAAESKSSLETEFLFPQEFLFLRPSTNWMRTIHIMQGNLLYSVYLLIIYNKYSKTRLVFD